VLMPVEKLEHQLGRAVRAGKAAVKRLVGKK
jgi:hypothetical protein